MTLLTAHQSAYLPWLGLFHKIALSDVLVILDEVQLEKNSYSNRNKIKGGNGEFWLTVPVSFKGHIKKKLRDIDISDNLMWPKKHLKAIESSYAKAPYFKQYISFFRECYTKKWEKLTELTEYMLPWFLEQLKIKVKLCRMSDFSFKEKKSNLVLEICRNFEADIYISGKLGKDYLDTDIFYRQGINVYFQEYNHPEYKQLYGSFTSGLSVIDLLFNHGAAAYDILMQENITKSKLIELYHG